jgi:hypothetical protein
VLAGAVAAFVLLLAVPPVFAQQTSPCAADLKQYCNHITPGGGRLLQCYEEQKDKFSKDCRSWVETAKMNGAALKKVCAKTLDARCNFEKGDPLEMVECLQSNYIELDYECRERLNEFKGRYPKPAR